MILHCSGDIRHGYFNSARAAIGRMPADEKAPLWFAQPNNQVEGWHQRIVDSGEPGILVGQGRRDRCCVCGRHLVSTELGQPVKNH